MKKTQLPSLNGLRAFEACARTGGVTAAAEYLGTTPSAVSHSLRSLEQQIGCALFVRTPGGLRLTPEGRRLQRHTGRAFRSLEEGVQEFRAVTQKPTLQVGCIPTFASLWLLPRLATWDSARNGFGVQVHTVNEADYLDLEGALDVIIDVGRWTLPDWIERAAFMTDCTGIVGHPDLFSGGGVNDVFTAPLIMPRSRPIMLEEWCGEFGHDLPEERRVVWYDHLHLCIAAARGRQGATLTSDIYVEADLASGALVAPLGMPSRRHHFFCAWHGSRSVAPFARRLVTWLRMQAGERVANDTVRDA